MENLSFIEIKKPNDSELIPMNISFNYNIHSLLIYSYLLLSTITLSYSQNDDDLSRTFMPNIQMGYINHQTKELSNGLITQTSIEYRDISNFIFRVNYDAFSTNMNLKYPINSNVSFTGKTNLSDLIIGIGYRKQFNKHNITGYIQPGLRFYGYPVFTSTNNNQINLDYNRRNLGVVRYSIGYEYALTPKLYLSVEGLISHTLKAQDFWSDNKWLYGATIGISAPLN